MNILATLRQHSTKLTGFSMVDADGNETHRSEERTLTGGRFESPDIEIMRDDLCRVLHEAAGNRVEYLFDVRDYVIRNQDIALEQHAQNAVPQATSAGEPTDEGENAAADGLPDFGALTLPFELKDYERW